MAKDVAGLVERVTVHLASHEGEVIRRLRDAASGDLMMPETLEVDEKAHVQETFGRIAELGPARAFARLVPLLLAEQIVLPRWEAAVARAPAIIGRRLPHELFSHAVSDEPDLRGVDKHQLTRFVVLLVSYILYEDFHRPQPETGVYNIAGDLFEKLKWVYRYWFNQLEVPQEGSGLAGYFASQDLHFPERGDADADATSTVSITCAGDLLAVDVLVPENTPELFDGIADFYSTADIVSANLESTVDASNPVGRTQPPGDAARMNTSVQMFQRFRDDGKINFFSTATNHALDWSEHGVLATLDVLRGSGADFAGTAASQDEQDDVVVVERGGIKVGLLTFTFDLNGHHAPVDKPYLVNEVRFNDAEPGPDFALVCKHIEAARAKGAEYLIAYCHWGWEFEMYPHPNVMEAAHTIVDLGVDTILGNHPHVSQPMERVMRDGRPDGLIVYAFGDFVSYHPESRNSKLAYSTRFDVVRVGDGGRPYLANLQMLPMYIVNAERADGSHDCRIVRFADVRTNPDGYGLTDRERSELGHLHDEVLMGVLVPDGSADIIA